jgi:hypothetical protein
MLSAKVRRAIARHLCDRNVQHSIETGLGASTLLFSHLSSAHTVFALGDGIPNIRSSPLFDPARTEFVEGPTQKTLAAYDFQGRIQAALLDGPHAFPLPLPEYYFIYPNLDTRALLIIDDIHIPSIHDLFRFHRADEMFQLLDVVDKTAFVQRSSKPVFDPLGDGWWLQQYNRRALLRFTWTHKRTALLPRSLRSTTQKTNDPHVPHGDTAVVHQPWFVTVSKPEENSRVGQFGVVQGSVCIPPGAHLWLLARRRDQAGWWPQGDRSVDTSSIPGSHQCCYGELSVTGYQFELALLVTDENVSASIEPRMTRCAAGDAPAPMPLPKHVPGCPPVIITVRRSSDGGQRGC